MTEELLALMQRGATSPLDDDSFNRLALHAFRHQFTLNQPYRRYCERRSRTPETVAHWFDIPAVPTAAFKEVPLVAGEAQAAQLVFKTSGTTRGTQRRGTHYILDARLYEAALVPAFRHFVLRDALTMQMYSLMPPADQLPESSLAYMITHVIASLGRKDSRSFASVTHGIDVARLSKALSDAKEPVCLLGTSLSYLHLFDALRDESFDLPAGSRLMDTGGFKGQAREISADDLRALYADKLGIDANDCVNEYGMTELCSQYYDVRPGVKAGPSWLRARIVDPDTLAPVARGETGIVQHFDLANLHSVCAVQTEDLAVATDDGFILLGRAPGATPRGCSIAMDILLSDNRA